MANQEIIKLKKNYLNFTGLSDFDYSIKEINCDICEYKQKSILAKYILWGKTKYGFMPIVSCKNCGYIYQKYQFDKKFNKDFYEKTYRDKIFKNLKPSSFFLKDQNRRGGLLLKFLKKNFSMSAQKKYRLLDVGCSTGMFLEPFKKAGWECHGNDPDKSFVEYGKEKLGLSLENLQAEDMKFKKNFFDVTVIMGSLEHCYNINKVLNNCYKFSKKNGILVLEARGDPQSVMKKFYNHNHYRYFTLNSLELIMLKHGWEPVLSTRYPITGPSRKGSIFCIGKKSKKINLKTVIKVAKKRETFLTLKYGFKYLELLNQGRL